MAQRPLRILFLTFYYRPDLCAGSFRATPLANEAIQLQFRQSVAANDALLVGDYSKRVTLTLSATTP